MAWAGVRHGAAAACLVVAVGGLNASPARSDKGLDTCKKLRIGMSLEKVSRILNNQVKIGLNLFTSLPCNVSIDRSAGVFDLQITELLHNVILDYSLFEKIVDDRKKKMGDPYAVSFNVGTIGTDMPIRGFASWNCPGGVIRRSLSVIQRLNDVEISDVERECQDKKSKY